jgi:hypothetical protein
MYIFSDRPGGYGYSDIYKSTRESTNDEWGPLVNLGTKVNTTNDESAWSVSADDQSLYLQSDRSGGYGNYDLWVTTWTEHINRKDKSTYFDWCDPINLGSIVNSSSYEYHPYISSDGLSLYFCSNRSGGNGSYDLYVTTRASLTTSWGPPVNLGSTVNSSNGDYQPCISQDGLSLFFVSTRPGGFGYDTDIWMTTRASSSDPWGKPVNLGSPINTLAQDDMPRLSADNSILYFCSVREGGYGLYDLYSAPIFSVPTCGDANHPYPLGDFNSDCHVNADDLLIFVEHWLDCTAPECDETP